MEWINEPKVIKLGENPDEVHPMCGLIFVGGGIITCYATGMLCDQFCGIYF